MSEVKLTLTEVRKHFYVKKLEEKIALLERKLELCKEQRDVSIIARTWPSSTKTGVIDKLNKELEELK